MVLSMADVVEDILAMMMKGMVLRSIADVKDLMVVVLTRIKRTLSVVAEERICPLLSHGIQTSPQNRPFSSVYMCFVSEMSVSHCLQRSIPIYEWDEYHQTRNSTFEPGFHS